MIKPKTKLNEKFNKTDQLTATAGKIDDLEIEEVVKVERKFKYLRTIITMETT